MISKASEPAVWTQVWHFLTAAGEGNDHPFRTPVVGNTGAHGARLRTLVLRGADYSKGELTCYTDLRSVKVQQLATHDRLSWLFWDPTTQLQFTASGPTRWDSHPATSHIFEQLPKHGRKAYATEMPPSTPLSAAGDGLPENWAERSLSETDYAADNFGVLVTQLDRAEVLHLDRHGSRRLTAQRNGGNDQWGFTWVVP